jgi:hypothetical protein
MNGNQQSSLQNIYSRSFPANNLLEISLVKDTNPELPFYKNKHFMFLSLTPGGQTDQGGRTFNRDGRITVKSDSEKIMALANSIRAYARGQAQLGQFAIFTDSNKSAYGGGAIKTIFAGQYDQKQQNDTVVRKVSLSFKTGQNKPIGVFWSPAESVAIADIFEFIAKKAIELDFDDVNHTVGNIGQSSPQRNKNSQQSAPQGNYQQSPPQGNTQQNIVDNFGDSMMNTNNQNNPNDPQIDDDIPF